jgi:Alginate lyase
VLKTLTYVIHTYSNHGSFFFSQFAALKILTGDFDGARTAILTYFATTWQTQIWENGEQPLEAARTRPYHYRAYNLNAMIVSPLSPLV